MDVDKMITGAPRPAALLSEPTSTQTSSMPGSFRTLDGIRPTEPLHYGKPPPPPPPSSLPSSSDVWAGAIARLQTQVSSNTSMLETQRRQLYDMDQVVHRLRSDMEAVVAATRELDTRLSHSFRHDHDPADLDVLAGQMAAVTDKLNEVESLRMQMELLRNRMKRLEAVDSPAVRTDTSSTRRDHYDYPPNSHHEQAPHPQTLPPMRPSSIPPSTGYPHPLPGPQLLSQPAATAPPTVSEPRYAHGEYHSAHVSPAQGYRPNEPMPPAPAVSGWRPAEPVPSHMTPAATPLRETPHAPVVQSQPPHPGWATVNQPTKRSYDEQRPYEGASQPSSPKRPRLAPIMPRSNAADDGHVHTPGSGQQASSVGTSETSVPARPRVPSNDSQMHAPSAYTPVSATSGYRFITTNLQGEGQGAWRPETEHRPPQQPQPSATGRGRGRGGRGRGRGNRTGGTMSHHDAASQELGPSSWDHESWHASQHATSPSNSAHLAPTAQQPAMISPLSSTAPEHRDFPTTPLSVQHIQPFPHTSELASAAHPSSKGSSSGKKKPRSKPIRNAAGILIRKDGRPDMRSVSSANNLRKVHAKKEAERAHGAELEVDGEGKTPTSGKSLPLAHANSLSDEEHATMASRTGTPASMREDHGEEGDEEEDEEDEESKEAVEAVDERTRPSKDRVEREREREGVGDEGNGVDEKAPAVKSADDTHAMDRPVDESKKVNGVVAHEREERGGSVKPAEADAQ